MDKTELKPNIVVNGPFFPEPVQVIVVVPMGAAVKLIGKGSRSGQVYEPVLTDDQLILLVASPAREPFDRDARKFRLGIEAMRLGLAYEYDPYFSLSIARVDPLPHQLEAVYDYFMKLPRIRFLLADDPGAGKTIMAGLLIKELKIRGLIKRILIITPANLTFQWQREMKEKFRENFEVIRSDVLRANYGSNPWQEKDQVVTSVSWVSRIEDAKESLLRSRWDLVIVDEAHKMSAYSSEKKTLAYQLGESLSGMTDHYLLMTATPHKGDPENFCLFLELLDRDVYGDIKSLEAAMDRHEAPFYLRRVKEALVSFPDPDTGQVKALFTRRNVTTTEFQISEEELEFYDRLTRYVEDQSIKAAADDSARGRALPEVIEDFFLSAAPMTGLAPKPVRTGSKVFKLGRIPRNLWPTGERLEPRFGKGGFVLEYDAARKIAQGLGANLEDLDHVIEVSGETARLLPVSERTQYLFGKEQGQAPTSDRKKAKASQMDLFGELAEAGDSEVVWGEKTVQRVGETTLDRVHQAMILFATGRGEAMERFLVNDGAGNDQRFWSLAQALSALYPQSTTEKRWVDGVLARKKGLGL